MKLRCPFCGGEGELPQFTRAEELLALDRASTTFGEDWPLVREYLECFRPPSGQALQVKKLLRLARDFWQMWHSCQFEVNRAWYAVGREEFREALRLTCNQVSYGLTNHNYLKKVLMAAARQTSQRREREFRKRETGLRTEDWGRVSGLGAADLIPDPVDLGDDPIWQKEFFRLGKEARRPGLSPEAREAAGAALRAHLAKKSKDSTADERG